MFDSVNENINRDFKTVSNSSTTVLVANKEQVKSTIDSWIRTLMCDIKDYNDKKEEFKNISWKSDLETYTLILEKITQLTYDNIFLLSQLSMLKKDIEDFIKSYKMSQMLFQKDLDFIKDSTELYKVDSYNYTQISINIRTLINLKFSKQPENSK